MVILHASTFFFSLSGPILFLDWLSFAQKQFILTSNIHLYDKALFRGFGSQHHFSGIVKASITHHIFDKTDMAEKIYSYYQKAEEIGGIKARAKLTMLTMVDSYQARTIPDTEEAIRLFEGAIQKLSREFSPNNPQTSFRERVIRFLSKQY